MDSVFRTPQVHIVGEIEGVMGFSSSKVYCRWQMYVGERWRLLSGNDRGETFYDCSEHFNETTAFEHPVDLHYVSGNILGWPKIYVEVWGVDSHGRHSVQGYGCQTMPTKPGHYELSIALWRPEGTYSDQIANYFLGSTPEILYKNMVLSGNDRFGMQCMSTGTLNLRIGMIVKDFNLHGIMM